VKRIFALALAAQVWAAHGHAQVLSERGFVDGRAFLFPQTTPTDTTRAVGDLLIREELFLKPTNWLQLAGGADLRANSHDQVDERWRLDWKDRRVLRPPLSLRRLTATVTLGPFAVDVGKQFIRWGRADVTYPTDRFAPRDYITVIDPELLGVTGIRPSIQIGSESFEAVWLPELTPSRLPLLEQRWTFLPSEAAALDIIDRGSRIGSTPQYGARWRHTGGRLESALSYFDGTNHLPNVNAVVDPVKSALEILRVYPRIRMYGADAAIPTSEVTLKLEAAYVTSPPRATEEYLLYVVEAERQVGEWLLDAGYAGDVVTRRAPFTGEPFAPDRGLARALIARAAYTIDPRRTMAIEGAIRQTGNGVYLRAEYSSAIGRYWRVTVSGVELNGEDDDFLGQYRRNSHAVVALRFSF
jgi:hypothetical protein